MSIADLETWIEENRSPDNTWFAKRLSANDTGATGGHQAGFYLPKNVLFALFPEMEEETSHNAKRDLAVTIDSHSGPLTDRLIGVTWYNQRTRDEVHVTRFGGRASPLQDYDNTGALLVVVFLPRTMNVPQQCRMWLCKNQFEETVLEAHFGPILPQETLMWMPGEMLAHATDGKGSCWLEKAQIPTEWLETMPSGKEIILKTLELRPKSSNLDIDARLISRRDCEFEVFKSIENAFYMGQVSGGFATMEQFLSVAQSVLQSRKSRAGKSLEYHVVEILNEEGFLEGENYSYNPLVEGKRPDFLFPSRAAYLSETATIGSTRMLAAKTTCKDRWRQVCNEVDRTKIPEIDLLTLQQGVSENQYNEMKDEGVRLIVPQNLLKSYPKSFRDDLMTFGKYIEQLQQLSPCPGQA